MFAVLSSSQSHCIHQRAVVAFLVFEVHKPTPTPILLWGIASLTLGLTPLFACSPDRFVIW